MVKYALNLESEAFNSLKREMHPLISLAFPLLLSLGVSAPLRLAFNLCVKRFVFADVLCLLCHLSLASDIILIINGALYG